MCSRKNVVVHEEDFSSLTIMKPFSEGYLNFYITVFEDAYGEVTMKLIQKDHLKKRLNLSEEEFENLLKKL